MQKLRSAVMSLSFGALLIQAADVNARPPAEQKIPRPSKPGVKTSGVQVSITELKPEAVYLVPGTPDWQAIGDAAVYVSNKVKNSVSKLDPKTNKVLAVIAVGSQPCSGLTIGFARMADGAHWLSDVLWASPITLVCSWLVWKLLLRLYPQ